MLTVTLTVNGPLYTIVGPPSTRYIVTFTPTWLSDAARDAWTELRYHPLFPTVPLVEIWVPGAVLSTLTVRDFCASQLPAVSTLQ